MRKETAKRIQEKLQNNDYIAKIWESSDGRKVRVYVSRRLSRRIQQIGFVEIENDGSFSINVDRAKARIRDLLTF